MLEYYSNNDEIAERREVVTTSGADNHFIVLSKTIDFFKAGYAILPEKLEVKRYLGIALNDFSQVEVQALEQKAIYAGQIKGVSPLSEIMQSIGESNNLHPVEFDDDLTERINADLDQDHEFAVVYALPNRPCLAWRCGLHYPTFAMWEKPLKGAYVGLPYNDPCGIKKRKNLRTARQLRQISEVLNYIDLLDEVDDEMEELEARWEADDWKSIVGRRSAAEAEEELR